MTPPVVAAERSRSPLMAWGIRLGAALIFYLALWIVLPGPTYPLLVLAVVAPEVSPLLLAGSLILIVAIIVRARRGRLDRLALTLAFCSAALALIPLIRVPATAARFEAAMTTALGADYLCAATPEVRQHLRPSPISPGQLFIGLRPSRPIRVTRGIEFARTAAGPLGLDLYRPTAAGLFPVVVQIYGGAWQRGRPDDDSRFASALAAAGYLVIALDHRHAPRWQFPAALEDVQAGLGWIRDHAAGYGGDTNAIAILGRSSGAELALLAAYTPDASWLKAAISYYGPVDLTEGYRHPPSPDPLDVRTLQVDYLGGTPGQMAERYRAASPISHLRPGLPPTLLIYGDRDHVVEPRFGRMLRDSLYRYGNTAVLLDLPWSEHAFDVVSGGPGSQLAIYQVERFLAWAFGRRAAGPAC